MIVAAMGQALLVVISVLFGTCRGKQLVERDVLFALELNSRYGMRFEEIYEARKSDFSDRGKLQKCLTKLCRAGFIELKEGPALHWVTYFITEAGSKELRWYAF